MIFNIYMSPILRMEKLSPECLTGRHHVARVKWSFENPSSQVSVCAHNYYAILLCLLNMGGMDEWMGRREGIAVYVT